MIFESKFKHLGEIGLPSFSGIRVMMMPLILGDLNSIPESLAAYRDTFQGLFRLTDPKHLGKVGYITIDEKSVQAGKTHRRAGLHVDGVFEGRCGSWGGGGGGGWGSVGNGMITISSVAGCRAWNQTFDGPIGRDGECDQLQAQCQNSKATLFLPNQAYWVDGLCVHESVPMSQATQRQFLRLSMPSKAPWFEGYTENPLGVKPTGEILARRKYMSG